MKASNGPLDIDVAFHVIDGDTAQESVAFVKSSRLAIDPPDGDGDVLLANGLVRAWLDGVREHNFTVNLCTPTNYAEWGLQRVRAVDSNPRTSALSPPHMPVRVLACFVYFCVFNLSGMKNGR